MNEDQAAALQVLEMADTSHSSWGRGNCPFCLSRTGKEDRRNSFSVNAESGYYQCFKCGTKGKLQGDRFRQVPKFAQNKTETRLVDRPKDFIPLYRDPGLTAQVFRDARAYLRDRGLGRAAWSAAGIGACFQGYFSERIIIPIMDEAQRNWHGFIARDWTGNAVRKYLYPKGMDRGGLLFQQHLLKEETSEPALIVEGVFDALPYVGRAVACLGKPTHKQFDLLCRSKRPLCVVLDGDAWEEGYALSQKLKLNGKVTGYVKLPAGDDPGSVDVGWLLSEVEKSIL